MAAYDVFEAFNPIGDIKDVQRINDQQFRILFAPTYRRPNVVNRGNDALAVLNDDCLLEICKHDLDWRDLHAIARTSWRLQYAAAVNFRRRYRNKPFKWHDLLKSDAAPPKMTLSEFVSVLRIFQPPIVSLCVACDPNITHRAIAEHCPNAKWLDVSDSRIDQQTLAILRPMFPGLRRIAIPATDILDNDEVDWQLEELYIVSADGMDAVLPNIRAPGLRKLVLKNLAYSEPKRPPILEFLARSAQVTTLRLDGATFSWGQWCGLAERMPNLEQLALCNCRIEDADDRTPGAAFNRLTAFELNSCGECEHFMRLLHGAPLKHVKLHGYLYVGQGQRQVCPIDSICRLATTTTSLCLKLIDYVDRVVDIADDDLVRITRSLYCLEELVVKGTKLTLAVIGRILSASNRIIKLKVGVYQNGKLLVEPAVLDQISAITAARPELHVQIYVCRKCIQVSKKLTSTDIELAFFVDILIITSCSN